MGALICERSATMAQELPEGTVTVLFTDVVGSANLTTSRGDEAAQEILRAQLDLVRQQVQEHSGHEVKGLGDGFMVAFASARRAVACAMRCSAAGDSVELQLYLGIHAGDVIREGNNVYGGAVNIAARIAAASGTGDVLASDPVRSLAHTSAGVTFDDRGEYELKGVSDPQPLFAVRGGGA